MSNLYEIDGVEKSFYKLARNLHYFIQDAAEKNLPIKQLEEKMHALVDVCFQDISEYLALAKDKP